MRCLTLARALPASSDVLFLSRGLPAALADLVRSFGFGCVALNDAELRFGGGTLTHSHWLAAEPSEDARQTVLSLGGGNWDWLVVDHYALDASWESAVRGRVGRLMVLDDLADREHVCDALLDQNLYHDQDARYVGLVPPGCRMLLGPSFALLRPEFRRLRDSAPVRSGIERVLVFFGGFDALDLTSTALDAIEQSGEHAPCIEVAIGAQHRRRQDIVDRCRSRGFECHVQTDDIADLMLRADLSFGASGSTSWERCCLGLPAVCAVTALNQLEVGRSLARKNAVLLVGDTDSLSVETLRSAFMKLVLEPSMLPRMSVAAAALVDGMGTQRVLDVMMAG